MATILIQDNYALTVVESEINSKLAELKNRELIEVSSPDSLIETKIQLAELVQAKDVLLNPASEAAQFNPSTHSLLSKELDSLRAKLSGWKIPFNSTLSEEKYTYMSLKIMNLSCALNFFSLTL